MPSHVKGSQRKLSRLVLQFARRYSGESFYSLTPSEWIPLLPSYYLDAGCGYWGVEIVTLKIRDSPSKAIDTVLMGTDHV